MRDEHLRPTGDIDEVLQAERAWLHHHNPARGDPNAPIEEGFSALCLSGGGIRSATFCLGALQALAEKGMLGRFDYLSTVSGGGYIGSWLSTWIHREGQDRVMAELARSARAEPRQVSSLRSYANYLSPVWGLSADFLSLIATFIRNLALHWCMLLPLLAAALMLPRLQLALLQWRDTLGPPGILTYAMLAVAAVLVVRTVAYVVSDLPAEQPPPAGMEPKDDFLRCCYLPLMAAAVLLSWLIGWNAKALQEAGFVPFLIGGALLHILAQGFGAAWRARRGLAPRPGSLTDWVMTLLSGALGGLAFFGAVAFIGGYATGAPELCATLSVPVLLGVFWVGGTAYAGAMSRFKSEDDREWWARAAAWWLGAGTVWLLAAVLVIYVPLWLLSMSWLKAPAGPQVAGAGAILLGILTSAAGYWSKNGADIKKNATGFLEATGLRLLDLAALIFTFALLVGMSIAVSYGLRAADPSLQVDVSLGQANPRLLQAAGWPPKPAPRTNASTPAKPAKPAEAVPVPTAVQAHVAYAAVLRSTHPLVLATGIVALLVLAAIASILFGINTFSLHSMYGNRLSRAYLGASNQNRRPHWFTGFDTGDNQRLAEFQSPTAPRRLFHVVNTALNLVEPAGGRLEWQQRKAASFTMTALHCGSAELGFVPTEHYGASGGGLSLGRAMAISGAAASPNMGYHSSKLVAFVMTFFNVRLGWWSPNPSEKTKRAWNWREPLSGIQALLREAAASATGRHEFVYLSDGGHFENLGLYEMVRRQCLRILVIDASCDPNFEFEDLHGAIRKIRIDFGVPVEFDEPLPTADSAQSGGRHIAVATIRYDLRWRNAPKGRLVYIKPVLAGDEALDIERFAAANSKPGQAFPHQPTSDQFFDEAQFESYRALGKHSVDKHFSDWDTWPVAATAKLSAPARRLRPASATGAALPGPDGRTAAASAGDATGVQAVPSGIRNWLGDAMRNGTDGLQHLSRGSMLAAAVVTSGALAVTGAVALSDNKVELAPGAKLEFSDDAQKLLKIAMDSRTTENPAADPKVLAQLEKTLGLIQQAQAASGQHLTATLALTGKVHDLSVHHTAALGGIRSAIENLKLTPAATATDTASQTALLKQAADSLKNIEASVKESLPRRTIRAVNEGGPR